MNQLMGDVGSGLPKITTIPWNFRWTFWRALVFYVPFNSLVQPTKKKKLRFHLFFLTQKRNPSWENWFWKEKNGHVLKVLLPLVSSLAAPKVEAPLRRLQVHLRRLVRGAQDGNGRCCGEKIRGLCVFLTKQIVAVGEICASRILRAFLKHVE